MIHLIPTSTKLSTYRQVTALDGVDYQLVFDFNQREGKWYFSLLNIEGNHLMTGRKVVSQWMLNALETSEDLPPGALYCLDSTAESTGGADPGLRELGQRVVLLYDDGEGA